MRNRRIKKCPKCGSDRVAPILYGLPVFDEDLKRKIESEEIYLGGCCVGNADPQFHCFACKKDIGTPPILQSSHGVEDYRDIVTSVQFSDGGYFGGFDEVFFQKTQDGIKVSITPSFLGKKKLPIEREVSEEEWETLLDKLFCRLYIHEWKKTYNDYTVCDGEQWSLELRLIGNRQRNYQGSNAFPPCWSSLKRVFKSYLDECPLLEEE